MFNQSFLHSTRNRFFYTMIFFMALSCFGLTVGVRAQEDAGDPVTAVEVGSVTVYRDAITSGSVTITCYDTNGNPVPNTTVDISVSSPGMVATDSGFSYSTSGTTDNNGNVTVSVKSVDFTTVGNDATVTLTASAEGVSGTGTVTLKGALQILLDSNTDVTNKTTACNIGEQQALTANSLSNVSLSAKWTTNGATPIGGWDGASSPKATTTTPFSTEATATKLFLTTTGSNATSLSAYDFAATGDATTSFTVSKPNDFSFTAVQQAAMPITFGVQLGDYKNPQAPPGIQFTGSGGAGGTLSSAQTLIVDTFSYKDNEGSFTVNQPHVPGLDGSFPYPGGGSPNDNPDKTRKTTQLTDFNQKSWSATMHLMWTSSKSGSIPIPVESITWSWNAHATFDPSTGTPNQSTFTGSSATSWKGTAENNGVLQWTDLHPLSAH